MAITPRLLCLLVAVILFLVAALWSPPSPPRVGLQSLGLAFFAAAFLFP